MNVFEGMRLARRLVVVYKREPVKPRQRGSLDQWENVYVRVAVETPMPFIHIAVDETHVAGVQMEAIESYEIEWA